MLVQKRFIAILLVLLIGLAAWGARAGSAQDGTPVGEPGASPAATPQSAPSDRPCTGIGTATALQVVMTIDERAAEAISPEVVDRTVAVLARRAASVSPDGCDVTIQADGDIRVTLAATPALDVGAAVSVLSVSARLEIVDTGGTFPEVGTAIDPEGALLAELGLATPAATLGSEPYTAILTGADIVDATATLDVTGLHQVGVTLTDEAADRFARYTAEHIGEPLAIVIDGEVVSAPIIQEEITGGIVVIQGSFSAVEAKTLETQLRSGALPVTLTMVSVDLIAPAGQATAVPIGEVEGVQIFTVETAQHTTDPVAYPQTPPVGGMHDPAWQNCGFYDAPVRNENAVHSLEHGIVWITYQPDLPPIEIDALRQLTLLNDRLLISPYPGLDAPIVLSTWDRQLRLESVDDPRFFAFIDAYTGQAPEPGANCQGGVGAAG